MSVWLEPDAFRLSADEKKLDVLASVAAAQLMPLIAELALQPPPAATLSAVASKAEEGGPMAKAPTSARLILFGLASPLAPEYAPTFATTIASSAGAAARAGVGVGVGDGVGVGGGVGMAVTDADAPGESVAVGVGVRVVVAVRVGDAVIDAVRDAVTDAVLDALCVGGAHDGVGPPSSITRMRFAPRSEM